jgi:Mitochondrial carrier protein
MQLEQMFRRSAWEVCSSNSFVRDYCNFHFLVKFLFGGSAGMAATCFVQPLDLVKNRMQVSPVKNYSCGYCQLGVQFNINIRKCLFRKM